VKDPANVGRIGPLARRPGLGYTDIMKNTTNRILVAAAAPLIVAAVLFPADGRSYDTYPLGVTGSMADLAADGDGTLHVLWVEGHELHHGVIVDHSITGDATIASDVSTMFRRPRLSVAADGSSAHTCWVDGANNAAWHAWWSPADGWQTEEAAGASADYAYWWPDCAVDGAGVVHAVIGWAARSGACAGNSQLYASRKLADGTWTAPECLTGDDCRDYVDSFMVNDPLGGIHYRWSRIGTDFLRYRYAPPGGSLGDAPTVEAAAVAGMTSAGMGDIAVGPDGSVHLARNDYDGAVNVFYQVKPAGEDAFLVPERVAGPITSTNEVVPAIGVHGGGTVFMIWVEGDGSRLMLATRSGGAWSSETADGGAGMDGGQIKPAIAVRADEADLLFRGSDNQWRLLVVPVGGEPPVEEPVEPAAEAADEGMEAMEESAEAVPEESGPDVPPDLSDSGAEGDVGLPGAAGGCGCAFSM